MLGTLYKQECILCLGINYGEVEFGILKKICVNIRELKFIVSKITTIGWNDHYQAYEVGEELNPPCVLVIGQSVLAEYYLPLHTIKLPNVPNSKFIVTRHEIPEIN